MTIKTLTYIHELLTENEDRRRNALEIARKAYNEAEDACADNLPTLEEIYQKQRENWKDAYSARAEFEAREW